MSEQETALIVDGDLESPVIDPSSQMKEAFADINGSKYGYRIRAYGKSLKTKFSTNMRTPTDAAQSVATVAEEHGWQDLPIQDLASNLRQHLLVAISNVPMSKPYNDYPDDQKLEIATPMNIQVIKPPSQASKAEEKSSTKVDDKAPILG